MIHCCPFRSCLALRGDRASCCLRARHEQSRHAVFIFFSFTQASPCLTFQCSSTHLQSSNMAESSMDELISALSLLSISQEAQEEQHEVPHDVRHEVMLQLLLRHFWLSPPGKCARRKQWSIHWGDQDLASDQDRASAKVVHLPRAPWIRRWKPRREAGIHLSGPWY